MFSHLSQYRRIFVTGPHRSGTTIAARMIAKDTGHDLVMEDSFNCSNRAMFAAFLHSDYGPQVIQCPFLCHEVHDFGYLYDIDMDECLVVMMHRYRGDIIESEKRSPVNFDSIGNGQNREHNWAVGHASDVKYDAWMDQCQVIPNAIDLAYESLRGHPLWRDDHKSIPFQHEVRRSTPPRVFADGLRALSNI